MFYVVEYTNLTFDQELELFNRVQKGMALNQAERLQGQAGPWPKLINLYVKDFSNVAKCKFLVVLFHNSVVEYMVLIRLI
jgi:hypothetical protein